jgi:hypothetical protein
MRTLLIEEDACANGRVDDVVRDAHRYQQSRVRFVLVLHQVNLPLLIPLLLAAFMGPVALLATVVALVILGRAAAARAVLAAARAVLVRSSLLATRPRSARSRLAASTTSEPLILREDQPPTGVGLWFTTSL